MAKIAVDQVPEFQSKFLELLRASHTDDVIKPLAAGKIDDTITGIITNLAASVCTELTN
jgi:F-type H+-transporting ATPase subunit alpha